MLEKGNVGYQLIVLVNLAIEIYSKPLNMLRGRHVPTLEHMSISGNWPLNINYSLSIKKKKNLGA